MLAQVKKLMAPEGRAELTARFGAWWDGRDYVPGEREAPADEGEASPRSAKRIESPEAGSDETIDSALFDNEPSSPEAGLALPSGQTPRLRALEMLWGEAAFAPMSEDLQVGLIDAAFQAGAVGRIGLLGVDGALVQAIRELSDAAPAVSEWRSGCLDRMKAIAGEASLQLSPVDRTNAFDLGSLRAVISQDCFAYSDHKAGLVARVHRALADNGRWVFVETVKRTKKTPAEAFASAWSEPLLAAEGEIEDLMGFAGFRVIVREDVTHLTLEAARDAFRKLPVLLEEAAAIGREGREGALFLRELSWEIQSWRSRMRALEGGALGVIKWVVEKTPSAGSHGQEAAPATGMASAGSAGEPMDQSAVDSLFD